jgi:hypothetical protein
MLRAHNRRSGTGELRGRSEPVVEARESGSGPPSRRDALRYLQNWLGGVTPSQAKPVAVTFVTVVE